MTDKVVVLVTVGSLREARKIAKTLVEGRLAACVNLSPAVQSFYRWKSKMETAREILLVIKTSREIFPELQTEIRKLHSYATPEIICVPIIDGSREYLEWLAQSVKAAPPAQEPQP